jgi:hypothetical protein
MLNAITYTAEQVAIIEAARKGRNLVVTAVAGSGKTTTLKGIAEAVAPRACLYLAYNKAIQKDAEASMPGNVLSKTAHSVAYGWMMKTGKRTIMDKLRARPNDLFPNARRDRNGNVAPWTVQAERIRALGIPARFEGEDRSMTDTGIFSAVQATVRAFCNSADDTITGYHVPREFDGADQDGFRNVVAPLARKLWQDILSPTGVQRFEHDHYLKMWSLACPDLRVDVVLFDEAQDANPCIASVVEAQVAYGHQVIMVGDSSQAIYGWRGAIDAMVNFTVADERLPLTQAWRFGQHVADVANSFLGMLDAEVRVVGNPGRESVVGPLDHADAILCRTNAGVIEHAMAAQAQGKSVAIVGGTKEIETFATNAQKLIDGRGMVTHPDLAGFDSWDDARRFAQEDDGRDIRLMVKLVDDYGTAAILDVCRNSANEDDADVIVSTAHKSKGREWDAVKIAADFNRNREPGELPSKPELMLLYVAVTRARFALDAESLAALHGAA